MHCSWALEECRAQIAGLTWAKLILRFSGSSIALNSLTFYWAHLSASQSLSFSCRIGMRSGPWSPLKGKTDGMRWELKPHEARDR